MVSRKTNPHDIEIYTWPDFLRRTFHVCFPLNKPQVKQLEILNTLKLIKNETHFEVMQAELITWSGALSH